MCQSIFSHIPLLLTAYNLLFGEELPKCAEPCIDCMSLLVLTGSAARQRSCLVLVAVVPAANYIHTIQVLSAMRCRVTRL